MAVERGLIVNGDDFGQSAGTTAGIIEAYQRGVLTSASLMVRWPRARDGATFAATHPDLSVGLHVDLGEWSCVDAVWTPLYEVVSLEDQAAVQREVMSQLDAFRALVGRNPTHLDSHQHVHRLEPARSILQTLASELNVPLRGCDDRIHYCGGFYGQTEGGAPVVEAIGIDSLIRLIAAIPLGVTELSCHPATRDDIESMYRVERLLELQALCDPRIPDALQDLNIVLQSFTGVPAIDRTVDLQRRA